jgi:hypothetical protein
MVVGPLLLPLLDALSYPHTHTNTNAITYPHTHSYTYSNTHSYPWTSGYRRYRVVRRQPQWFHI